MKKIIISIFIGMLFVSCTRDDINSDPHAAYTTIPSTLVTYAQKELSDYVNTCSVNENNFRLTMQYWQETTYIEESNYNFTNRNVSNQIFLDNYVNVLNSLVKAKDLINAYVPIPAEASAWPKIKQNQLAVIDMMQVYVYQNLVDTYGNIPYSQSNQLSTIISPSYDDGSTIYVDLISRLQTDIANIDVAAGINSSSDSFSDGDLFYKGDLAAWKIFGNSLLLKLGIGIADSNPTLAQQAATSAINNGIMGSSTDNCQLQYLSASPNRNPIYDNVRASNRNDFVGGKTLVDYMNGNNDTRITKYYRPVGSSGNYIGQTIGVGGSFSQFSAPGDFAYSATTPGIILNYTEVAFYLTEASARWGIGGSPATNYGNAITSSFTDWGVGSNAAAYIAAHPYNTANWKQSVGQQAWVAMYNQPLTSWNFWRRLDYPVLQPASAATINSVPVRMNYPVIEYQTNGANVAAAATAIGGDLLTTKLFWDKF
ncbi:SusD/RagB family nutrient-binding outer membrane lipoprotein [Chryseobacterium nematophagum]|uniref:SusD/RagB family nutrient-binding outer membrane lipoprotein n=1 Tax=Chryseobacterium nematophagum TaxID=2305228 RepID=A0A3M7L8W0_9FLAO|nr:SusD/RagB family nutrient-binding outer membrane lipoprotein [Chryseobacterium nematophagum]RMZ57982.1 SusD/RagB family nutrient-binding outer membrane lipoprotein [Chryseobacterium nematophagum]